MHIDLSTGEAPERLENQVCIIGAGAAGIIMARRLLASGCSVLLLESGGLDYERDTAALNAGENAGEEYYDLEDSRLRFFGGTTAIWGGRCAELSSIDLARRAWVPHSGWPISYAELTHYYREARSLFGLPKRIMQAQELRVAGVPLPDFAPEKIDTPLWNFDNKFDRFSFPNCADLVEHPKCIVLTHATVTEIRLAEDGNSVASLDAADLSGRKISVHASSYVLATGGIENARLLLASNSVQQQGVGNGHDQVGRYFMEHPHARGGRIVGGQAWKLLYAFSRRHRINDRVVAPLVALAPELQEAQGLLNTSLTIAGRRSADGTENWAKRIYLHAKHKASPTKAGRRLWKTTKLAVHWVQGHTDPLRPWLLHKMGRLDISLVVRAEQAPNPASRVMLAGERDVLGVPRVKLDWRTSALDKDSVAGLVAALGAETKRLGIGTVEMASWLKEPFSGWKTDPLISTHPIGGYHHMGTTRMSASPSEGVTDHLGQVHGVANLYVAGSSLFPTSGWANPTLTIAALALRTADYLSNKMLLRGLVAVLFVLTLDQCPLEV